jgi:hypothetical protein
MSPVYAYKAAKHVELSNFSLRCNSTVDIVLRAKNTNLNRRCLTRIFCPASDGFHKRYTSHVAFDRLPESVTSIVACLESTSVRTGEQMAEVFVHLSVPGYVAPLLVTPVILDLKKITMKIGANFCT